MRRNSSPIIGSRDAMMALRGSWAAGRWGSPIARSTFAQPAGGDKDRGTRPRRRKQRGARTFSARGASRGATAASEHRHCLPFGVDEDTGHFFYAMELVEGETLEERVRRTGPLDTATTIAIARQVVDALALAEKNALVHRDLKPANVMLVASDAASAAPVVKIIDFGLAKALTARSDPASLTQGGFVGTPAFASPEQFSSATLDVRSDVYSLGLTLWFALTGRTPFRGRTTGEIRQAQESGPLPTDQLRRARVPSGLIALLRKMLALEPAERPGQWNCGAARRIGQDIANRPAPDCHGVGRCHRSLSCCYFLVRATPRRFPLARSW